MKKLLYSINIYVTVTVIFFLPYFNWEYAKKNGFMEWLVFGEIIATGKALVWPYYILKKQKNNKDFLITKKELSIYINKINSLAPIEFKGGYTTLLKASHNNTSVIFYIRANIVKNNIDAENFLKLMELEKKDVCNNESEAEGYLLKRNISIKWNYLDAYKNPFGTVNINPEECIMVN